MKQRKIDPRLYYDAAASTPLSEGVRAVLGEVWPWGNNNSLHEAGHAAGKVYAQLLERAAAALGVTVGQVLPNWGGTHANQRVLQVMQRKFGVGGVWGSNLEHSSVADEIAEEQTFDPFDLTTLPCEAGVVFCMHSNNETGVRLPLEDIRRRCPEAVIVSDWVQSYGKVPFALGVADIVTLSAHKWHGPKGVGLTVMKQPEIWPVLAKDSHTKSLEQLGGVVVALEELGEGVGGKLAELTGRLEAGLGRLAREHRVHHGDQPRVPGITSVSWEGVRGAELMRRLSDKEGICVSTGSACNSSVMTPSRIVATTGVEREWQYPIRVSFHRDHRPEDVDFLLAVLEHYLIEINASE